MLLRLVLGPFWYLRGAPFRALAGILAVVLLTLLTQTGGLLLWLGLPLMAWCAGKLPGPSGVLAALGAFLAIYLAVNLTVVPWTAASLGRERLPCFPSAALPLQADAPLFCLMNRHYVRPALRTTLEDLARALGGPEPGRRLRYLDAGFPFGGGFPMLPHLSHRDGRDVDLAFFWRDAASGDPLPPPSPLGYWVYAGPRAGEAQPCRDRRSYLRWDFDWLQPLFASAQLDRARSADLFDGLLRQGPRQGLRKVLLEPHLRDRLALDGALVRFQGCHAARHDDHLHLSFR